MKHFLIGAAAILALAACTTAETEPDMSVTDEMSMETGAMMLPPEEGEEVCAIRDPEDGECLCREVNENGECTETGGVIVIPQPAEPVEQPTAPTGGVIVIPDGAPQE